MGLSDESRHRKLYFGLFGLRRSLERLDKEVNSGKKYWRTDKAGITKELIASIDEIMGMIVHHLDNTSLYWCVGSLEGYAGLFEDHANLACNYQAALEDVEVDNTETALSEFQHELTMFEAATKLSGGLNEGDHRALVALALWWEAWQYVPSVLYPMHRYADDAIPKKVKTKFTKLIGKMALTRYAIIKQEDFAYTEDSIERLQMLEQVFLCKYKMMGDMLYQMSLKASNKEAAAFNGYAFLSTVKSMSMHDTEEYLAKMVERDQATNRDISQPNMEREMSSNLFGAKARSRQVLEEIMARSNDYAECKKASEEARRVHGLWSNGWELRFKKAKKKGKKR